MADESSEEATSDYEQRLKNLEIQVINSHTTCQSSWKIWRASLDLLVILEALTQRFGSEGKSQGKGNLEKESRKEFEKEQLSSSTNISS